MRLGCFGIVPGLSPEAQKRPLASLPENNPRSEGQGRLPIVGLGLLTAGLLVPTYLRTYGPRGMDKLSLRRTSYLITVTLRFLEASQMKIWQCQTSPATNSPLFGHLPLNGFLHHCLPMDLWLIPKYSPRLANIISIGSRAEFHRQPVWGCWRLATVHPGSWNRARTMWKPRKPEPPTIMTVPRTGTK